MPESWGGIGFFQLVPRLRRLARAARCGPWRFQGRSQRKVASLETACILFNDHGPRENYGTVVFQGRNWQAHRLVWTEFYGPIPDGMCVLHKCDVPACVRPDHLELGTQRENMLDMVAKGRHKGKGLWKDAIFRNGWINITEAARRLGVTRQWVFRLCKAGRIAGAHQIGRQWVLPSDAEIVELPGPRLRSTKIPQAKK